MCSRVPVIVILGATGSGKSKLGIEIARRFGGEIISADSMQAYKGLDIITNKVTAEERAQAPHHLLDMVTPPRPFSVVEFRDAALPIVERLLKQNKVPVVVGGTNYYIESLMWRVLVSQEPHNVPPDGDAAGDSASSSQVQSKQDDDDSSTKSIAPDTSTKTTTATTDITTAVDSTTTDDTTTAGDTTTAAADSTKDCDVQCAESIGPTSGSSSGDVVHSQPDEVDPQPNAAVSSSSSCADPELPDEPLLKRARLDESLESLPSPELHRRLQEVDPDMARRLHPNNRRRIIRIT